MHNFMAITKALADENRVRVILALSHQELCVCQIIELLALAPSTVSKHMSILKQARLVEARKEGRWVYYRLPGDEASGEIKGAISWICDSLSRTSRSRQDAKRLQDILKVDPRELCEK